MRSANAIIPSIARLPGVALCGCILVLPLLAGGATPLGTLAVRLSVLGLLVLCLFENRPRDSPGRLLGPFAALLGLAVLGLLQAMPWPRGVVRLASPAHLALADDSARAMGETLPSFVSLSLYPAASFQAALDLLVFAGLAFAVSRVGSRRAHRVWLAGAVVGSAGLQVVLGLRPWLAGQVPRLRGLYANPDHLCLLLEVAAVVACAALFWARSTRRFEARAASRAISVLVTGALLLLLLAAIAFTGSRAALLAIVVGLVVQVVATSRNQRLQALAIVGAAGITITSFLAWVGFGKSFGRLLSTSWFDVVWTGRSLVWRECLDLIGRFPILGTGLGTFDSAFPLVQPASLEGIRWAKAHNDFLELTVTAGGVGMVIASVGVILLIKKLISKQRSARGTEDRAALSAAFGCLAAVAVHEALDFGLTLPANAFVFIAVVAAAMAIESND